MFASLVRRMKERIQKFQKMFLNIMMKKNGRALAAPHLVLEILMILQVASMFLLIHGMPNVKMIAARKLSSS